MWLLSDHSGFTPALLGTAQALLGPWRNPPRSSCTRMQPLFSAKIDAAIEPQPTPTTLEHADAVICGGGPVGLLAAIMLAQKLPEHTKIRVYDRLSQPPNPDDESVWSDEGFAKFYLIGLGGRGQTALKEFGVWEEVEKRCIPVIGRRDYNYGGPPEGVERIFTKEDYNKTTAQVLPRDKLVGVLHKFIQENYSDRISTNYDYELRPVDFEYSDSQVLVEVGKCVDEFARVNPSSVVKVATEEPADVLCDTENVQRIATNLLVAADGTVRTIANAMEAKDKERLASLNPVRRLGAGKPFRVKRYKDDNQRVYKTIPIKLPPEWRGDLNYSARSKGNKITFDALPASKDGDYCGALLLKKEDEIARADTDPVQLRRRLDEALPQFSVLLEDNVVATVAKKPISYLPGFRYAGPRLHEGNRCVILGDCAHTVKPYFGLGANSALEDVKILGDIMDRNNNDLTQSVLDYSKSQAGEAKTLVRISRDLDRPGKLGFITFILPLILDATFHRWMPRVFQPNIIAMLQRESYTFQQVGFRKRCDRLGQVLIIAAAFWSSTALVRAGVSRFSSWVGFRGNKLWAMVAMSCAFVALGKRLVSPLNNNKG